VVRIFLYHFAAIAITTGGAVITMAQDGEQLALVRNEPAPLVAASAETAPPQQPVNDPVADPRAVVTLGHARFTVLTPQLIRMEWAADGKFEDHASFVFLNRRLPVPKFTHSNEGGKLTIQTSALQLTYT